MKQWSTNYKKKTLENFKKPHIHSRIINESIQGHFKLSMNLIQSKYLKKNISQNSSNILQVENEHTKKVRWKINV